MTKFLEDWRPGETARTPGRTITESDVMLFAGLTGDYNEIHTNAAVAGSLFPARVAHGLLGLGISHGLLFRLGWLDGSGLALLAVEEWQFKAPILIGDTVFADITVQSVRPSATKPDRGVVRLWVKVVKSDGEVAQEGAQVVMVRRRPG